MVQWSVAASLMGIYWDGVTLVSVLEKSGATKTTTSSMYMEVVAITETFRWLKDTDYDFATIVTDSMNNLEKVRSTTSMPFAEWKDMIQRSNLSSVI